MWRSILASIFAACTALAASAEPLFYSSVTSNDIDYIRTSDPDAFACLTVQGRARMEMPDKRGGALFADNVLVFEARYLDGKRLGLWAHPDLGDAKRSMTIALPVARAVGKLPDFMRNRLSHIVLHRGDETAFGESEGRFFVLYSENVAKRVQSRDLEETVFHESVHATLDSRHLRDGKWRRAQRSDGTFITGYAQDNLGKEDLAETMLLAYTALLYPGRMPAKVELALYEHVPNRMKYFTNLLAKHDKPMPRRSKNSVCN